MIDSTENFIINRIWLLVNLIIIELVLLQFYTLVSARFEDMGISNNFIIIYKFLCIISVFGWYLFLRSVDMQPITEIYLMQVLYNILFICTFYIIFPVTVMISFIVIILCFTMPTRKKD